MTFQGQGYKLLKASHSTHLILKEGEGMEEVGDGRGRRQERGRGEGEDGRDRGVVSHHVAPTLLSCLVWYRDGSLGSGLIILNILAIERTSV